MSEFWHSLSDIEVTSSNKITTDACIAADSPWFSGHFPDDPVLPGIAEISMAVDAIKQYEKKNGRRIMVTSLKKVRFRIIVKPNDTISITVVPDKKKNLSYSFKVDVKGETACSGIIFAKIIE